MLTRRICSCAAAARTRFVIRTRVQPAIRGMEIVKEILYACTCDRTNISFDVNARMDLLIAQFYASPRSERFRDRNSVVNVAAFVLPAICTPPPGGF